MQRTIARVCAALRAELDAQRAGAYEKASAERSQSEQQAWAERALGQGAQSVATLVLGVGSEVRESTEAQNACAARHDEQTQRGTQDQMTCVAGQPARTDPGAGRHQRSDAEQEHEIGGRGNLRRAEHVQVGPVGVVVEEERLYWKHDEPSEQRSSNEQSALAAAAESTFAQQGVAEPEEKCGWNQKRKRHDASNVPKTAGALLSSWIAMNEAQVLQLLERIAAGTLSASAGVQELAVAPFRDVGVALVDHHRSLRQGVGEVIWGEGKSTAELLVILREIVARGAGALATRIDAEKAALVLAAAPELALVHDPVARTLRAPRDPALPAPDLRGTVGVITAGTSDEAVARECAEALTLFEVDHFRLVDVGVAGLHRLLAQLERIRSADVLVVIAGMEGALPSVIGGLVSAPVIAVPTSVGYGAALSGFAALTGMLTSCASGITVCNVDNGFGAAFAARRVLAAAAKIGKSTP